MNARNEQRLDILLEQQRDIVNSRLGLHQPVKASGGPQQINSRTRPWTQVKKEFETKDRVEARKEADTRETKWRQKIAEVEGADANEGRSSTGDAELDTDLDTIVGAGSDVNQKSDAHSVR